ncbi:MAG: hypothetical protein EHM90_00455 [Chloroflexi bacterium]|nr:MAG: hypothetical protein EHM90_00455 [Chloroflexota bacterium]
MMFFQANTTDDAGTTWTSKTNFTKGTRRGAVTGTGCAMDNARRETSTTEAAGPTVHAAATAPRTYVFGGFSFKPPPPVTALPIPPRHRPMRAAPGLGLR